MTCMALTGKSPGGHMFRPSAARVPQARWLQRAPLAPKPQPPAPPPMAAKSAVPTRRPRLPTSGSVILFVDSRAADLNKILELASGSVRIVLLDRDTDGIGQIAKHLRERHAIDAIFIATSDERGRLSLGCSSITVGNLYAHEDDLRRMGEAMSPTGRICLLGRASQSQGGDWPLQVMLSRLTGVTVDMTAEPAAGIPWREVAAALGRSAEDRAAA